MPLPQRKTWTPTVLHWIALAPLLASALLAASADWSAATYFAVLAFITIYAGEISR